MSAALPEARGLRLYLSKAQVKGLKAKWGDDDCERFDQLVAEGRITIVD